MSQPDFARAKPHREARLHHLRRVHDMAVISGVHRGPLERSIPVGSVMDTDITVIPLCIA
jgi:hypothetical protein